MTSKNDQAVQGTTRHPAAVRWQPAHGNCANPVQPPVAGDIGAAPCKLIWVRRDDWDAFLAWQAEAKIDGR